MAAPVLYINGMSGIGKMTVAKLIQARLEERKTQAGMIHNHMLIDPVEKTVKRSNPSYQEARRAYRLAALKPIGEDPELRNTTYIFTDCQPFYKDSLQGHHEMAKNSGRRFYSVILSCSQGENERRVVSPGRGKPHNGKLNKAKRIRQAFKNGKTITYKFGGPDEMELDTTELTAEETANKVVVWFEGRQGEGRQSEGGEKSEGGEADSRETSEEAKKYMELAAFLKAAKRSRVPRTALGARKTMILALASPRMERVRVRPEARNASEQRARGEREGI